MNTNSSPLCSMATCAMTLSFCIAQVPPATKKIPPDEVLVLHQDLFDFHSFERRNLDSEWKPGAAEKGLLSGVPISWYGTYRCVDPSGQFQFVRLVRGYEILFGEWDNPENQIRWIQHGSAKFTATSTGVGAFDIHLIEAPAVSSTSTDHWLGEFKVMNHGDDAIRIELTGERQNFGCYSGDNPPKISLHLILTKIAEK